MTAGVLLASHLFSSLGKRYCRRHSNGPTVLSLGMWAVIYSPTMRRALTIR